MTSKQIELQRAISKIENIYPKDNLITTYEDFLKHREFLHLYQYNPIVFNALISLTFDLWRSDKRISRFSLIAKTRRYFVKNTETVSTPAYIRSRLFKLFKSIVVEEDIILSIKTIEKMKFPINRMLQGIKLTNDEISFLCANVHKSFHVLNRVLRYPYPSNIISKWARQNFEKDFSRVRRAEMTSWIIDEDPTFEIDEETLTCDFKYLNIQEKEIYNQYEEDMGFYKLVYNEINPIFEDAEIDFMSNKSYYSYDVNRPILKKIKRFYGSAIFEDDRFQDSKIDVEKLENYFYTNIENIYSISMAWSIAYSRLDNLKKIEFLKKYYSPNIYWTFFRIGKKIKSIKFLEWLKTMAI